MKELQTVALGLIVVFVDVGSPDWIADPLGWLLVLVGIAAAREHITDYGYLSLTAWVCLLLSVVTWPPESVPHLDSTLGWLFSLPTLAFCFMLADSLTDVTTPDLAGRFRAICWAYAVVMVLPLVVLLMGWDSLQTPSELLAILVNLVLVISLFSASDEDNLLTADDEDEDADTSSDKGSDKDTGKVASAAESAKEAAKDTVGNLKQTVRGGTAETVASAKGAAKDVKDKVQKTGTDSDDETDEDDEGRHKA